jgi:hypothetical protein
VSAVELSISDCFSNKDLIANQDRSINNRTSRFRPLTSHTIRAIQELQRRFLLICLPTRLLGKMTTNETYAP